MTPSQQLQKLLAEASGWQASDIAALLPLAAALQSVLHTRMLTLQQQAALPDTDFLLSTEAVAERLGKSTKWLRDNVERLPFAIRVGREHRFFARGLEAWIAEQQAAKMAAALPPTRRQV